ncbi:MAG: methyltransferase domain-containing protein [Polyangiaceae bacterium]
MSDATQPARARALVRDYYGRELRSTADLKTTACCAAGAPPEFLRARLANIHPDVENRFYGCGFPLPHALSEARVLDLGCGTGRDVYILAQLVGPSGWVHGVDMTPEQLQVAERTLDWHVERFGYSTPNVSFHHGYIEELESLGFQANSLDVVVSNCVVNLSPRKDLVLEGAWRVLKPGGEFYFSDVVADRRLAEQVRTHPVLQAECLGGALYHGDLLSLARRAGFGDPRLVSSAPIAITDPELQRIAGAATFESVTYRLFKLDDLDERCEDYGQVACYRGGIEGAEVVFWLDDHHAFEAGRPERVCGNTARMLSETRLRPWFEITGSRAHHFGLFPCGSTIAADGSNPSACC